MVNCWMKLIIDSQTSTAQLIKYRDGLVISPCILLGMRLLIHVVIQVNPCSWNDTQLGVVATNHISHGIYSIILQFGIWVRLFFGHRFCSSVNLGPVIFILKYWWVCKTKRNNHYWHLNFQRQSSKRNYCAVKHSLYMRSLTSLLVSFSIRNNPLAHPQFSTFVSLTFCLNCSAKSWISLVVSRILNKILEKKWSTSCSL